VGSATPETDGTVSLDQWQALGIVCGSLLTLLTLVGLLYRWVVRPVWRTLRRLNEVADQLLGDKAKRIPSMTDRMAALERELAEHVRWHSATGRGNGPRPAERQQSQRRDARP
jgi:hypothetical protein